MSPRPQDPAIRSALVDAAARLLVAEGPSALTTRRLAATVGTSTMAVYTYFSGMEEVRAAVAREGFARLAEHLDAVEWTGDAVEDIAMLAGAYVRNAVANPHLYRFMFTERLTGHPGIGQETFGRLVVAVQRAIDEGRIREADPANLARQLWVSLHGIVSLHVAGLLSLDEALQCLTETGVSLLVAFGDARPQAQRSIDVARRRTFATPPDAAADHARAVSR